MQPTPDQPSFGAQQPPQAPYGAPPPYGYQQPYPGPMPPTPGVAGDNGPLLAGLSYLIFLVGIVLFFAEQRNRFVKFHAAQSLAIHLTAFVGYFIAFVLFFVGVIGGAAASSNSDAASPIFGVISLLFGLLMFVISVLYLIGVIWGMIVGFTGKYTKLPLVGGIAERWSGSPAPQRP